MMKTAKKTQFEFKRLAETVNDGRDEYTTSYEVYYRGKLLGTVSRTDTYQLNGWTDEMGMHRAWWGHRSSDGKRVIGERTTRQEAAEDLRQYLIDQKFYARLAAQG